MRSVNAIIALLHLFVIFMVMSLGACFIGIALSEEFRLISAQLLYDEANLFLVLGGAIIFVGCAFFALFYWLNKRRYIQISMNCTKTKIDESIIYEYIKTFWKTQFEQSSEILDVSIKPNQKLEVTVSFDEQLEDEQILQRIQSELGVLLARRLGYEKDFILSIVQN